MTETELYRRVQRVLHKAEKMNYQFNEIELGVFNALGRVEWNEEKTNWLVLQQFETMYRKFFPIKNR